MDELKLPEIKAEKLKELLKKDFEDCIAEVVEAVDTAKAGSIIDDSEEPVRKATAKLRQKIFQKALQMKLDAVETAFSPSQKDKDKK
ncbi:MAG: hypothetical protein ACYTFW_24685 [Planctomycetota bacterium]|jgi:hypothetical protein